MLKEYWNRAWQPLVFHLPHPASLPSLLLYSAVSISPSRGSSISACGDQNGTGEEWVGLGGNFWRLRNIRDLLSESLGFRFSWAFLFTKSNGSYQLHTFKGIHPKMKNLPPFTQLHAIPNLNESYGWKYQYKKKKKRFWFPFCNLFCMTWCV